MASARITLQIMLIATPASPMHPLKEILVSCSSLVIFMTQGGSSCGFVDRHAPHSLSHARGCKSRVKVFQCRGRANESNDGGQPPISGQFGPYGDKRGDPLFQMNVFVQDMKLPHCFDIGDPKRIEHLSLFVQISPIALPTPVECRVVRNFLPAKRAASVEENDRFGVHCGHYV